MINKKYEILYNDFIEHYKRVHINPWHEINEEQLNDLYDKLINVMDVVDIYSFKYFVDYIMKRLCGESDAHTKFEILSLLPINFRIFDNDVLVNYPDNLKNSKLLSINDINIDVIIKELIDTISYGTEGKKKYELEKSLFNKVKLFGIPSLRGCEELVFEVEKPNGEKEKIKFSKDEKYSKEQLFDYDKYRYGNNATYRFVDNCLIYNHSSVQMKFKEKIEKTIERLKSEDLSNIDTIIIDIRGNTGGNSALNKILMDFIKENNDKKIICLTDYRVFSGGRYALVDLINLGAITIGEEISTPINCYGNSNWLNVGEYYFSVSECYFNPLLNYSARSKEEFKKGVTKEIIEPYIFHPDILVLETKEDYIDGIDTILNFAIQYSKEINNKLK